LLHALMKRRAWLQAALGLGLSLGLAPPAAAQSVELAGGVKFEPTMQLGGKALTLNGAGIRYKAIFKVYAAGLYLGAHATTPEAVYAAPGPKRIRIVMYREIDANELGKLFTQGMEKNVSPAEFTRAINGTIRLGELFAKRKKLVAGDYFDVDWVPGTGSTVLVNGHPEILPIKEPEFFNALMSIWLGKSPADSQLRLALLGQSANRAYGQ
jgi:hypothetical protein